MPPLPDAMYQFIAPPDMPLNHRDAVEYLRGRIFRSGPRKGDSANMCDASSPCWLTSFYADRLVVVTHSHGGK